MAIVITLCPPSFLALPSTNWNISTNPVQICLPWVERLNLDNNDVGYFALGTLKQYLCVISQMFAFLSVSKLNGYRRAGRPFPWPERDARNLDPINASVMIAELPITKSRDLHPRVFPSKFTDFELRKNNQITAVYRPVSSTYSFNSAAKSATAPCIRVALLIDNLAIARR